MIVASYDELDDEALLARVRAQQEVDDGKKEDTLLQLLEQATLIEGKKGRGKTQLAVGISWEIRERFGCPLVAIGTTMGLKPSFGPYQLMSTQNFRDELERLTVAAEREENAEQVARAFEKYGVSIIGAVLVFDEARKLFNSRAPTDKLIQLCCDFFAQQRHYHVTTIILVPDRDEVDKRMRRQVDWLGRAYYNQYTRTAHTRLVRGLDVLPISVDGASDLYHTPFQEMYDTHVMIGFRRSSLNVKL